MVNPHKSNLNKSFTPKESSVSRVWKTTLDKIWLKKQQIKLAVAISNFRDIYYINAVTQKTYM